MQNFSIDDANFGQSDDVRIGTKAIAHHSQLQLAWEPLGFYTIQKILISV